MSSHSRPICWPANRVGFWVGERNFGLLLERPRLRCFSRPVVRSHPPFVSCNQPVGPAAAGHSADRLANVLCVSSKLLPKQKRISIHPLYCSCLVQLSDARLNAREAHIRRACYFIPLYTFFPLSDPGFSTSHFLLIDRCWGLAVAKANNIPFASFYEGFSCSWKSRLSVKCKLLLCEPIARFANFTRKYPH